MIKLEIDIEKAKEQFFEYVNNYDKKNENIDRKIYHSLRVMEISRKIAEKLKLGQEEIELATLIGLLHDIARFEQYKKFKTYNDIESFDHGDYGVKLLFEDKLIRKFINSDKYDDIIRIAIKNHNKYEIEEGLYEKEILFSQIIRDADKIDIIYEAEAIFWTGIEEEINKTIISENVLKQFKNNKQIKRDKKENLERNVNDILGVIAFIFDINFKCSFEIIKNNDYINKILKRFDFEDEKTKILIEEINKSANEFIKQKVKE